MARTLEAPVKKKPISYRYEATTGQGRLVKGTIKASGEIEAERLLIGQGYHPMSVEVVPSMFSLEEAFPSFFSIKPQDVIVFSRQMATLLRSGISLLPAIEILGGQVTATRTIKKMLLSITDDLRVGSSFSQSIAKYPNIKFHLDKYQPVITSDHKPYGIHRARQPEWFEDPQKIICVRKTRYPKFALIPEVWYGDQAVLIIRLVNHKQISPHLVLAILNSKVAHFWLFHQKRQGNQLQIDKEVLLHFPFPDIDLSKADDRESHDSIVTIAKKVAEQKTELEITKSSSKDIFGEKSKELQADIDKTKRQIYQKVYELYGLTEEEKQVIEASLVNKSSSRSG